MPQVEQKDQPAVTDNPYANSGPRYYALGILTLVYTFNFIDRQLLAILQEGIKADLGLSDGQLGLLTGLAFAIFYVVAGVPIARWADHANRRNIISLAVFIWSFMTALSGAAQNYLQLLLARIGVGIGEAGGSPPAHSMISDMFPVSSRAWALGIFTTGINAGILFGFLFGGWLNEYFGWRAAFVAVGVPGILVALLVRYQLKEPIRGLMEARAVSEERSSFRAVVSLLWSRNSFRHMAFACGLIAFAAYAILNWTASFMVRTHGMSTGELGSWLAMIFGVGGALGILVCSRLADKLGANDKRWYVWISAATALLSIPLVLGVYSVNSGQLALLLLVIPGSLLTVFVPLSVAMIHGLVGLRMRATGSAILYLVLNIIGLGGGPWCVGMLSDYLAPTLGVQSLGAAMLYLIPAALGWSALHFLLAGRRLREELAQAPD